MTSLQDQQPPKQGTRGVSRFQINLPMRYRLHGERVWRDGWVDNMSLTEILFSGTGMVDVGKSIDIRLVLLGRGGGRGGTIVSKAKVTRSWPFLDLPGQAFIAATLINPRIVRFDSDSARG